VSRRRDGLTTGKRLEIRPRAERPVSCTCEHHGPDVPVVVRFLQRRSDGRTEFGVDGVQGMGPVQGEALDQEGGVVHGSRRRTHFV